MSMPAVQRRRWSRREYEDMVEAGILGPDRTRKLRAYARNGVPEYWIVNLVDLQLEVYRSPAGEAYTSRQVLTAGDAIRPLFADTDLPVADLLP